MEVTISIISIFIALIALGVSYLGFEKSRSLLAASKKSEIIVETTLLIVEMRNELYQLKELESEIRKNSSDVNAREAAAIGQKNCELMLKVGERLMGEIRDTSIDAIENDLDQYTEIKGAIESMKIQYQASTKSFEEIKSKYKSVV